MVSSQAVTLARYTAWVGAIAGTFSLALILFTAVMQLGALQQDVKNMSDRVAAHDSWIQSIVSETQQRLRELEGDRR